MLRSVRGDVLGSQQLELCVPHAVFSYRDTYTRTQRPLREQETIISERSTIPALSTCSFWFSDSPLSLMITSRPYFIFKCYTYCVRLFIQRKKQRHKTISDLFSLQENKGLMKKQAGQGVWVLLQRTRTVQRCCPQQLDRARQPGKQREGTN